MLRTPDASPRVLRTAILLCAAVGAAAAALVAAGNPGHMGVCGACFLRDLAGAVGFSVAGKGPAIFRPELAGLVAGAFAWRALRGGFVARSGSYASLRFLFGVLTALAALVLLGCPFRLLQRLGGGDPHAWIALPGFVAGVLVATRFEARGYRIGTTSPAPAAVGLAGPALFLGLAALFLGGKLFGPGPDATHGPAHAPWALALGVAAAVGAILSATGFCAVAAVRSAFGPRRAPTYAAVALVVAYAVVSYATGRSSFGAATPPIAHGDAVWNLAAAFLLGLCGAFAGGCPVRQLVMTGEGNGDALTTVAGLVVGGAAAHNFGTVSVAAGAAGPGGPTTFGKLAVAVGIPLALLIATAVAAAHRRSAAGAADGARNRPAASPPN